MGILNTTFFTRMKGWKTLAVNAVIVATGLGTATGLISGGLEPAAIDAGLNGILGGAEMILGGVNIFLRFLTNSKVGAK